MHEIDIKLDGDGCWPDLNPPAEFTAGEVVGAAYLPEGTVEGFPSITLRVKTDGGHAVLAQTTLKLFMAMAAAFLGKSERDGITDMWPGPESSRNLWLRSQIDALEDRLIRESEATRALVIKLLDIKNPDETVEGACNNRMQEVVFLRDMNSTLKEEVMVLEDKITEQEMSSALRHDADMRAIAWLMGETVDKVVGLSGVLASRTEAIQQAEAALAGFNPDGALAILRNAME